MSCDIYYDGECPFCTSFVQLSKLREKHAVKLFNLRDVPDKVAEFTNKGYDVNEGMIVDCDGKIYFGHEAVGFIGQYSDTGLGSGKIYRFVFSNPHFTKLAYPFMRGIRNLTLKLLGRGMIGGP